MYFYIYLFISFYLFLNDFYILSVIDSSRCTHESPNRKPDWLQLRSLSYRLVIIYLFATFLWTGIIFAFFLSLWKHSFIALLLKRICRDFEIEVAHNFHMRSEIPSQPLTLLGSNERISLIIALVSMLKSANLVTASMILLLGRELSFVIYIVLWKSH